jgi:hypothetical protein
MDAMFRSAARLGTPEISTYKVLASSSVFCLVRSALSKAFAGQHRAYLRKIIRNMVADETGGEFRRATSAGGQGARIH